MVHDVDAARRAEVLCHGLRMYLEAAGAEAIVGSSGQRGGGAACRGRHSDLHLH